MVGPAFCIPYGLTEQAISHLSDSAGTLSDRDKDARRQQALSRMLPTRKHLKADYPTGAHVDKGLVVRNDLARLNGTFNLGLKFDAIEKFLLHLLFKAVVTTTALHFGRT